VQGHAGVPEGLNGIGTGSAIHTPFKNPVSQTLTILLASSLLDANHTSVAG
jgi:hypothetical protein